MTQLTLADLVVTAGPITEPAEPGRLVIDEPITRARARCGGADAARLEFVYHGETARQVPAHGGTVFQQIALQLRTPNPCNVLYVGWRLQPAPELVVQTKWNPDRKCDCDGVGYRLVARRPLPVYQQGESHSLAARLATFEDGWHEVICRVDGVEVLRATVDPARLATADCRTGFRTDNGRYSLRYFVEPA